MPDPLWIKSRDDVINEIGAILWHTSRVIQFLYYDDALGAEKSLEVIEGRARNARSAIAKIQNP